MDKSKLRSDLVELLRDHLPHFERTARLTCMLSIRLDGSEESAVFLDIVETLPALTAPSAATASVQAIAATASAATAAAAAAANSKPAPEKSKRKSQAPQKIVANGEDTFVSAVAAAASPSLLGGEASSSSLNNTGNDFSAAAANVEQAVNLTSGSSRASSAFLSPSLPPPRQISTPVKEVQPTGRLGLGFFVNNPGFGQQHFLLPSGAGILTASVFPTPTTVFQTAMLPQSIPPPTAKTPPGLAPSEERAAVEEDKRASAETLPKLPIMPASSGTGMSQGLQHRSRSLFGLRSRRSGHKSFPCNQCHETFGSLAALSKHTYTNHKGYKCTFCSANFTQRSNLQRHSLKHVGFKPFACRCCQKSYYRKDHLVRHIEVTHPGKEPKKSIETKLSSAECLEYLERKYESGEYSITLDADADEEMPEGEAADAKARPDGDEEMPDAEEEEDEYEAEDGDDGEEEVEEAPMDGAVPSAAPEENQEPEQPEAQQQQPQQALPQPPQLQQQPQTQPQPQPQQPRRGQRRQLRRQEATSEGHSGMRLQIELPANGSA